MNGDIGARLQAPLAGVADAHTFRLGLVLNGTVAAGAWMAGVLDALTEALDCWEAAKPGDASIPQHKVRIDVLGGASGGGVCAALLARAATRRFPHVGSDAGDPANPFWQVWVETLDIAAMLDTDDLSDPKVPAASLLNGKAIRLAADAILSWGITTPGVTALPQPRPWLADPLHVTVTLTNLRGIPYSIAFEPPGGGAPAASYFVDHADHALFAFPASAASPAGAIRGDETRVGYDFVGAAAEWVVFGAFVKATGAFPVGFPPVRLSRPTAQYEWRAVMLSGGKRDGVWPAPTATLLTPAWSALPDADRPGATYTFDCVDGGACNNQPVELVRESLAGLGQVLERDSRLATAAVVLLDPFAAAPDCPAPGSPPGLLGVVEGLGTTWKDQARFATSDLLLALDPTVFSRFLMTAHRVDQGGRPVWGGKAIASSGLGAFLGFLDRAYRVHDYMLGRKNCREWLSSVFVLDQDNPVFGGFGATAAADDYRLAGTRMLPIIPLVAGVRGPVAQPAWPAVDPATDELEAALKDRLDAVLDRIGQQSGLPCTGLLSSLLAGWLSGYARRAIEGAAQATTSRG